MHPRIPMNWLYGLLFQIFIIAFIFSLSSCGNNPVKHNRKVYISEEKGKYTLYRNGKPYYIKGAAGFTNLEKLHEIGGNTIRTWDTLNLASILDDAQKNNMAVIVGLPLPESKYTDFIYNNPAKVSKLIAENKKIVNRFKNHPALLIWCVGNELIFENNLKHYNFYKSFNAIVDMVRQNDPDHPITTTIISLREIPGMKLFTDVDFISINIFSSLSSLRGKMEKFSAFYSDPFLITEWGIAGPWLQDKNAWGAHIESTSTKKAEQYLEMYNYIPSENSRLLGSFVFYWGYKQETTSTWFSLFNEKGKGTEAVGVMQYLWTGKWPKTMAPKLNYMLVDGKGAKDNIIFKPGVTAQATLSMPVVDSSGTTVWEIYPEDWYVNNNKKNTKKIKPVAGAIVSSKYLNATFKAPDKEGPYRIFATIYDSNGNFATCNTPFYVISN